MEKPAKQALQSLRGRQLTREVLDTAQVEHGPGEQAEREALLAAYDKGVADEVTLAGPADHDQLPPNFAQRLDEEAAVTPVEAAWAVNAFMAHAQPATPPATTLLPGTPSTLATDLQPAPEATLASLVGLAAGSREAQTAQLQSVQGLGWPLEVTSAVAGLAFRLIPAGSFVMGSPATEMKRDDREPERDSEGMHRVTLTKAFYCGKYPVTQAQWQLVMGSNPSEFEEVGPRGPVENISWTDCQSFIAKLCELEGVAQGTYRMLTEAEWEYACRGGTRTTFCFGDSLSAAQANFDGDYPYGEAEKGPNLEKTTPVGSYPPNAWGLYDMHGNVWEWCADWHDYAESPTSPVTDPGGPAAGEGRVDRGGSWGGDAGSCRSAVRGCSDPTSHSYSLGLRLARQLV